jgi:hypothetical protein
MCLIFLLIQSFVSASLSLKIERATNLFNDSIEPIHRISEFEVQVTHCADIFLPIIYELKGKKQQGYLSIEGSLRSSQEKQECALLRK